ncbi:MAG: DUF1491 family protein [Ahrensia sp.]
MARLTSDLFVSALLNNAQARGIFGGVIAKGFSTAGAVHIVCYNPSDGCYTIYSPAPQVTLDEDQPPVGGRAFEYRRSFEAYGLLQEFVEAEKRFDNDLWVVELEAPASACDGLFSIIDSTD